MALFDIISRLARDYGFNLQDEADHGYLVDIVKQSSKDFYDKYDLRWCHFEQRFTFDKDTNLLTLPWYVKRVGAIRNVDQYYSIATTGMARRYRDYDWPMQFDMWRQLGEVPTEINLVDASPLKFTIPLVEDEDIDIVVLGKTNNSHREIEELTIVAGQLEVSTSKIWEPDGLQSIIKKAVSKYNVIVSAKIGGVDTDVAMIANVMLESRYVKFQAFDIFRQEVEDPFIEVYFKHVFVPMLRDYDTFVAGPQYENALEYTAKALLASKDDRTASKAGDMLVVADQLCKNADNDIKNDEIESCIASPNPIEQAMSHGQYSRSGSGQLYLRRGFTS